MMLDCSFNHIASVHTYGLKLGRQPILQIAITAQVLTLAWLSWTSANAALVTIWRLQRYLINGNDLAVVNYGIRQVFWNIHHPVSVLLEIRFGKRLGLLALLFVGSDVNGMR